MSNHTHVATAGNGSRVLLDLGKEKPQHKMLQLSQAFSSLYYQELVKPEVMRQWEEEEVPKLQKRGVHVPAGPSLPFRNEVLAHVFARQPKDIQERCERFRQNKFAEHNDLPFPGDVGDTGDEDPLSVAGEEQKATEKADAEREKKITSVYTQYYYHLTYV